MPEEETLHIHKNSPFKDLYILLLLIPSLVFVFILVLYIRSVPHNEQAYTKTNNNTYAKEKDGLAIAQIKDLKIPLVVANSEIERREGLGNKDSFPQDLGMLFVFDRTDVRPPFWMKGMRFDLDIIWINDGVITQIDKNLPIETDTPDTELTLYLPNNPVDYVLEVNAGFSDEHNLQVGDTINIIFD